MWIGSRYMLTTLSVLLGLSILACESMPLRTLRGARLYSQGSESLENGDAQQAILELEQAAALVPQASEIQNHLGLAYWAADQPERARVAFDRAIELDCDNDAARRNLDALEATTDYSLSGSGQFSSGSGKSLQSGREDTPPPTDVGRGDGGNSHGG